MTANYYNILEISFNNIIIELVKDALPVVPAMADKIETVNKQGFYCNNVQDIKFSNVSVSGHLGPAFEIANAEGIEFIGCRF